MREIVTDLDDITSAIQALLNETKEEAEQPLRTALTQAEERINELEDMVLEAQDQIARLEQQLGEQAG